ncbi:MAG: hypothetical protein RL094_41 [Candidatus Parcubacteria bacterium]
MSLLSQICFFLKKKLQVNLNYFNILRFVPGLDVYRETFDRIFTLGSSGTFFKIDPVRSTMSTTLRLVPHQRAVVLSVANLTHMRQQSLVTTVDVLLVLC